MVSVPIQRIYDGVWMLHQHAILGAVLLFDLLVHQDNPVAGDHSVDHQLHKVLLLKELFLRSDILISLLHVPGNEIAFLDHHTGRVLLRQLPKKHLTHAHILRMRDAKSLGPGCLAALATAAGFLLALGSSGDLVELDALALSLFVGRRLELERLPHVFGLHPVGQVNPRNRFGEPHKTFQLSHCDARRAADVGAVLTHLLVAAHDQSVGLVRDLGPERPGHPDVRLQLCLGQGRRMVVHLRVMLLKDVLGHVAVLGFVTDVLQHKEEVESRHDWRTQLAVLVQRQSRLIVGGLWQDGGQNGSPGIQRRFDAGLGERNGLLLHRLMNGHHVLGIHAVELIDAANSAVSQHQSSRLDQPLIVEIRLLHHGGRQTCGSGRLPSRKDGTRQELRDPAKHLALARRRIP
mmetsp:Transcript_148344/g.210710  ORF Transcript_148344/g.210710 Transcript_148344/m.210710 type:complete len:405 (+) Transcript_148344:109-1323(+)